MEGLNTIEPVSILFLILVQFGGRYLKVELTPAQQKIINNKIFQLILLFSIVYMATKNVSKTIVMVLLIYIFLNILFNENHKYNVLSKKWLVKEKIINKNNVKPLKEIYKKNVNNLIIK